MSSSKNPPVPNWRTHPLAQKILKPFQKQDAMLTSISQPTYLNAVYYPNWKIYSGIPPASIDVEHVSHVYYAFIGLKPDGTVTITDEHADTQVAVDGTHGCLNALRNLKQKNPHLKTILSIGGGGNGSNHFAGMASSATGRANFASSAEKMMTTYGLDGIDVDWEHPTTPSQGKDYVSLLAQLRATLSPAHLLTSALPAGVWSLKNINLVKAASYLDYVNLMAYDFAGPWTSNSGYQAQLHTPLQASPDVNTSGQAAVQYMVSKGIPPRKVLLGIPVYGRSFLHVTHINQKFKSSGGNEGTFDYKDLPRPGTHEQVDQQAIAAYCVGGDGGLVTYDNPHTVQVKAGYVKQKDLGGLFYWTTAGDAKGSRSLVTTGYNALHGT